MSAAVMGTTPPVRGATEVAAERRVPQVIRKLQAIALDCADPVGLAEFYAELLGGRVVRDEEDSGWVEVHGFEGTPLACQRVDGYRPPEWPGQERPQQLHLDFDVDDLDGEEKRALALGATVLERTDQVRPGANWRVYADPAGHPFCLCFH
ncbi:glyoxalase [Streptomyces naganishii JCM 4654]|uniref:Glyoxalase n=1 Tax=Streptomyces naganishii JCM 4654 TaxID=1306179 RepID=A0A919CXI1_9ACTN|nr:glyoxalase [Streptomyces naganishii JCM 4654]